MGFIAAGIGSAAVGVGSSLLGYFLTDKSTPRYNYKAADKALNNYMGATTDFWGQVANLNVSAGEATYQNIDPTQTANQAMNWNAENLDNFAFLASSMNQSALDDKNAMLDSQMPGWDTQRDIASKANTALLKGEIPLDVQQQMARTSAYQSFQSGYSGSPSARQGVLARDLGLTSLGLQQMGQSNAQSWMKTIDEVAMPDQVGSEDIMGMLGMNAQLTTSTALTNSAAQTDTQLANIGNTLKADMFNVQTDVQAATALTDIYGTQLSTKLALESQKLADQQKQKDTNNAATSSLVSGIGSSLSGGLGSMFGGASGYSNYF